jgi:hypothetical protein
MMVMTKMKWTVKDYVRNCGGECVKWLEEIRWCNEVSESAWEIVKWEAEVLCNNEMGKRGWKLLYRLSELSPNLKVCDWGWKVVNWLIKWGSQFEVSKSRWEICEWLVVISAQAEMSEIRREVWCSVPESKCGEMGERGRERVEWGFVGFHSKEVGERRRENKIMRTIELLKTKMGESGWEKIDKLVEIVWAETYYGQFSDFWWNC